jgi:hypothetical protein
MLGDAHGASAARQRRNVDRLNRKTEKEKGAKKKKQREDES